MTDNFPGATCHEDFAEFKIGAYLRRRVVGLGKEREECGSRTKIWFYQHNHIPLVIDLGSGFQLEYPEPGQFIPDVLSQPSRSLRRNRLFLAVVPRPS